MGLLCNAIVGPDLSRVATRMVSGGFETPFLYKYVQGHWGSKNSSVSWHPAVSNWPPSP